MMMSLPRLHAYLHTRLLISPASCRVSPGTPYLLSKVVQKVGLLVYHVSGTALDRVQPAWSLRRLQTSLDPGCLLFGQGRWCSVLYVLCLIEVILPRVPS